MGHLAHEDHEAIDPHAGHQISAAHGGHDRHAGHSVAMFRDKLWLSFALTIPVVFWSTDVQDWFESEPRLCFVVGCSAAEEYAPRTISRCCIGHCISPSAGCSRRVGHRSMFEPSRPAWFLTKSFVQG